MGQDTPPRDGQAAPDGYDPRVHTAVTDLYAYVLLLDAECRRVGERLSATAPEHLTSGESIELAELRVEMAEELDALRTAIAALREGADAASRDAT
jgi:hypothetical protein